MLDEGIGVDVAADVGAAVGIGVFPPGAADVRALLDDLEGNAGLLQAQAGQQAGDTRRRSPRRSARCPVPSPRASSVGRRGSTLLGANATSSSCAACGLRAQAPAPMASLRLGDSGEWASGSTRLEVARRRCEQFEATARAAAPRSGSRPLMRKRCGVGRHSSRSTVMSPVTWAVEHDQRRRRGGFEVGSHFVEGRVSARSRLGSWGLRSVMRTSGCRDGGRSRTFRKGRMRSATSRGWVEGGQMAAGRHASIGTGNGVREGLDRLHAGCSGRHAADDQGRAPTGVEVESTRPRSWPRGIGDACTSGSADGTVRGPVDQLRPGAVAEPALHVSTGVICSDATGRPGCGGACSAAVRAAARRRRRRLRSGLCLDPVGEAAGDGLGHHASQSRCRRHDARVDLRPSHRPATSSAISARLNGSGPARRSSHVPGSRAASRR